MLAESQAYFAFQYCPGIGPKTFAIIKKVFTKAAIAWLASEKQWQEKKFPPKLIEKIFDYKNQFNLLEKWQELAKLNINYLPSCDENFPKALLEIADCPIGLFVKGNILATDQKAIAVVGTRKVSTYGREVTQKFVSALALRGFTIISGLARGIDGIAHRTAIGNGGRTIAVLGSGLNKIYPPEHHELAEEVIKHGALISEYPPGIVPVPGNFPARNRLVSGLALGVLVTEGASKSGSKITAMSALDQNREVFAVPGPITNPYSQGPGELIQMGAKLTMSVTDILAELKFADNLGSGGNGKKQILPKFDDQNQEKIWQFLVGGNQHIDDIIRHAQLTTSIVSTTLTMMEIKGMVKNLGEGRYMAV